jgi:hypothetical protein
VEELKTATNLGANLAGVSDVLDTSAEKGGVNRGFKGLKYKGKGDFKDVLNALKKVEDREKSGKDAKTSDVAELVKVAKKWLGDDRQDMEEDPLRKYDPVAVRKRKGAVAIVMHEVAERLVADLENTNDPNKYDEAKRKAEEAVQRCKEISDEIRTPPTREPGGKQDLRDREKMKDDAANRVKDCQTEQVSVFNKDARNKMLAECGASVKSDLGVIVNSMVFTAKTDKFESFVEGYQKTIQLALDYINNNGGKKNDKLSPEVVKCKQDCQKIIAEVEKKQAEVERKNLKAVQTAQLFKILLDTESPVISVTFEAAQEMQKLLDDKLLSNDTKIELQEAIDAVNKRDRETGYGILDQKPNATGRDRAEILNRHGCFKQAGGGTSVVRLLKNKDGSIASAFKSVAGESKQGLDFLKLGKGASSMREDISSTINNEISNLTKSKLDLGFPNARVESLDGVQGALVQGLAGKMVDKEARDQAERNHDQKAMDELDKNARELPDKISAASLQKVVLSSVMTGQWDVKWGNMIVDGDTARPLDGGAAIPTKAVLRRFYGVEQRNPGPPSLDVLTCYPEGHPNEGDPLPNAQLPMDQNTVDAIKNLDVDAVVKKAKARRDELVKNNGFDKGLMDDECLDIVGASMQGAKDILTKNPKITLVDFAKEYQAWFADYADKDPIVHCSNRFRLVEKHGDHYPISNVLNDSERKARAAIQAALPTAATLVDELERNLALGLRLKDQNDKMKIKVTGVKTQLTGQSSKDADAVAGQLIAIEELSQLVKTCEKLLCEGPFDLASYENKLWPEVLNKAKQFGIN